MNAELTKRCEMFIANRDIIKSEFAFESTYIYPLCAALFTSKGVYADAQALRASHTLLKRNTGLFSNFRGTAKMATVVSLALSDDPQDKMERLLFVYGMLKDVFWASEYLTVAASVITDLADRSQYEMIAAKTRAVYDRMKTAHPILTSGEDSAFAALLALSGLDDELIGQESERCYSLLKPEFFSGNAVQSLSHVLALGNEPAQQKCCRVMQLFSSLKSQGYKYGTGYELPTLGALVLTDSEIEPIAKNIAEADDFLKSQKGFGAMGVGAKQRLMYAGILVMNGILPGEQTMEIAALNGIVSLIIAQHAAICAAVSASAAASAAANSSN